MNKSTMLAGSMVFIVGSSVLAQDIPDPNPVPNGDGTHTYYSGQNMQFTPGQAIFAAVAGDEIVIMGSGVHASDANKYVESLDINKPDLTIRPNTQPNDIALPSGGWGRVTLWNPTEGPESDNGFAIRVGENTQNTNIGRPSEMTQLANGAIVMTSVPNSMSMTEEEFSAGAEMVVMCRNSTTGGLQPSPSYQRPYAANGPNRASALQAGIGVPGSHALAFRIESRSVDDVAIRSEGSQANFNCIAISSQNGFGGGIMITGDGDSSNYINCTVSGTYSGGQDLDGNPVHAVFIGGGNPMFNGCRVFDNTGAVNGVINQTGGAGHWNGCVIGSRHVDESNRSPVSNGIYCVTGGARPTFSSCSFKKNLSRFGTVYFNSTASSDSDYLSFTSCDFDQNETIDGQWGATAYCVDAVSGRNPLVSFDRCEFKGDNTAGTQQGRTNFEHDVVSNYFPRYRMGRDCTISNLAPGSSAGGVANATEDGEDPEARAADVNGDGVVDGMDLALVLGAWD
jgi:hypothetical protein